MWAADGDPNWSYTVQNGDGSGSGKKLDTSAKTFTIDATHVWSYADSEVGAGSPAVTIGSADSKYCLKFGSSKTVYFNPVILSTDAFSDVAITKVSVYLKHNGKKTGTLTVKQGSVSIGTYTTSETNSWITVSSDSNTGEGGTLEIKYEVDQALYINKIEVWYEELSGTKHTLSSAVSPANSGTVTLGSNSILEGKTTTIKAEPADGYYFVNWTVAGTGASVEEATDAETTFTMGTTDATVTANFAEINFWAVTYDYNDGVTANEEVRVLKTEATSYTLKAAPTRESYNFTGWKIGESTYAAGAAYEPTGDVTVQAQWEFDGTLITYNRSDKNDLATGAKYVMVGYISSSTTWKYATGMGSNTYLNSGAAKAVFYDETPEIITLNETGSGWTMTNANGKKIGIIGDKQLGYDDGDMTWELGGTDDVPTFAATNSNKLYTMYFNASNGRFNAYNASAQNDVYFYRLADGKDVYTLLLDFNDGATADEEHRVLEGAEYTLVAPTRTGYAFAGWNTEEDGTGTSYTAGAYTMPADNAILYAQWVSNVTVSVTDASGYATYTPSFDLVVPEETKISAYKASLSGDDITFTKVATLKAGEGYLLAANGAQTETFTVGTATANADNVFVGVTEHIASLAT